MKQESQRPVVPGRVRSSVPAARPPAWRAAGYLSTLLGVVCLMASTRALSDEGVGDRSRAAGGWVALGGSAFFLGTGFRLLRERTEGGW